MSPAIDAGQAMAMMDRIDPNAKSIDLESIDRIGVGIVRLG
jgi:hypothetical protein